MTSKTNLTAGFALDLMREGMITIPAILLRNYSLLEISELELVIIIQFLYLQQLENTSYLSVQTLASKMSIGVTEVDKCLRSLLEKKLISQETFIDQNGIQQEKYTLFGLFDRLSEVWAQEKIQPELGNCKNEKEDNSLAQLQGIFESEFGRLLSPMEIAQIIGWLKHDNHSDALIQEALRISVLRGIFNFRYVDTILREWKKNNITTVMEAKKREQQFLEQKEQSKHLHSAEKNTKGRKDKFKKLYMN